MTKTFLKFRSRVMCISGLIMISWIGLSLRLFHIQIIDGEMLQKKGFDQGHVQQKLNAVRGNIYDRNNTPLTRNIIHYSLAVQPSKVENLTRLAECISTCTGKDVGPYIKQLESGKSFVYLERNLQRNQCGKLLVDKPKGLIIERNARRYYPHENIGAQVVGFVDVDDRGLSGIEKMFEDYLSGTPGWVVKQMSGRGKSTFKTNYPMQPPLDGGNVQLTIDLEYQAILQDELAAQLKRSGAISAMGIILNPQTGDILSMASLPDFDPNNPGKGDILWQKNKVITDQFEPGSTFKIVPITAAVEQKTVAIQDEFNCENGQYFYAGKMIRDWDDFGLLTISQIIENSSNVGIIKIAETLNRSDLFKYSRDYGFGTMTNIRISGESSGTLRHISEWSNISLAEVSLGHEVGVTTLQLGMAYAAIANGGFLMRPRLAKQIMATNGEIIYEEKPEVIRKVVSKDVMQTITNMLCGVVESGTGTKASIKGWSVAGKTGTAQKFINGQYSNTKFISNFVGFLPADNPQLVCAIVLDEPKIGYHWGGHGAAPVFRRVMERIINMDDSIRLFQNKTRSKDAIIATGKTPPLSQSLVKTVTRPVVLSNTLTIQNEFIHDGNLYLPDVRGLSLRKARTILKDKGLRSKFTGSGKVFWQSPSPGTIMEKGSFCTIGLK